MKPSHALAVKIVASVVLGATLLVALLECQLDFVSIFEGSRLIAKTLPFEEYRYTDDLDQEEDTDTEVFLAEWLPVASQLLEQPAPLVDYDRTGRHAMSGDEWLRWNAERAIQISQRQAAIDNGDTLDTLGTETDPGNVYSHTPRFSLGVLPNSCHQLDSSLSVQQPLHTLRFN